MSIQSPDTEPNGFDPNLLKPDGALPDGNGELENTKKPSMLKPRAYQEEMLAESLRQNIIIAVSCQSLILTRRCETGFDFFYIL